VTRLIVTVLILAVAACYVSHRRLPSRAGEQGRRAVERWEAEGGAVPPSGNARD
jgi:hypothetical protein